MIGLGTIINTITIMASSLIGLSFKRILKDHHQQSLKTAIGLMTFLIGIVGTLEGIYLVEQQALKSRYLFEVLVFLVLGALLGSFLRLSDRLERFNAWVENRFGGQDQQFAQAFISASLIFCVGAMSLLGAIQDGMAKDPTLLYLKSMLDGITSIVLASSYGIGVFFAFIPVFAYQMSITLLASFFGNVFPVETRELMNIIGNILIIGLSFNILEIRKIDVVDLLPALFLPIIYLLI